MKTGAILILALFLGGCDSGSTGGTSGSTVDAGRYNPNRDASQPPDAGVPGPPPPDASSPCDAGQGGCCFDTSSILADNVTMTLTQGDPACPTQTVLSYANCIIKVTGACTGSITCSYNDPMGGSFNGTAPFTVSGQTISGTVDATIVTDPPDTQQIRCTFQMSGRIAN